MPSRRPRNLSVAARGRAALLGAALLLAASSQAHALDLSANALKMLDSGRPYVDVRPDSGGASGVIRGAIDIAAPQATVWEVITDCDHATMLASDLKSCRIVDRDPQGRWDVREHISRPGGILPQVRSVFREDFDPPNRLTFKRTGGDLQVFEGEWRLTTVGDKVRVTYEARVAAPFSVPGWVARIALRHEVSQALVALRREAMRRASGS